MDKLLTIIIPVYCVSDTIDRCLESIVGQQYDRMEIILVDDGSPDDCPGKCDKWALRDSRINVIHKSNGGLSDARNAGIEKARGEYLMFIDSDDYIAENSIPELMRIMAEHPEYDILEYPVYRFFGSPQQEVLQFDDNVYYDMTDYWLSTQAYAHTYAWNKVYIKTLFDNVRFPVGKIFEDAYTLPLILEKTKVVATTRKGLYYYCWNGNGITAKAGGKEWEMLLDAHMNVIGKYERHPLFYIYYMHVVNIQLYEYELTGNPPRLKLFSVRNLHGLNFKLKLKAIAVNILGIKTLCILSKLLNKMIKCH